MYLDVVNIIFKITRLLGSCLFNSMSPYPSKSEHILKKCYTIFQIICYLVHNGKNKRLLHVNLRESVHDTCTSKTLIQMTKKIRFCISYGEL